MRISQARRYVFELNLICFIVNKIGFGLYPETLNYNLGDGHPMNSKRLYAAYQYMELEFITNQKKPSSQIRFYLSGMSF